MTAQLSCCFAIDDKVLRWCQRRGVQKHAVSKEYGRSLRFWRRCIEGCVAYVGSGNWYTYIQTGLLETVRVFLTSRTFIRYSRIFWARYLRVFTAHVFIGRCKAHCNYDFRTAPWFRGFWSDGTLTFGSELHAHTEETLLRCYTIRTTECGVGVGRGGMLAFGPVQIAQKKPFYVATQY